MLQSLLQPSNQRLAVRHERRRADKRAGRRPSQLPLQIGRTTETEATPSPDHHFRNDLYICGKVSVAALHAIVGSLLLGIVVLVVGLVQLSPGAEAAQHRYYLMGAGAALVGIGVLGAVLRCLCLHWYNRRYLEDDDEAEDPTTAQNTQKNCVSVVDGGNHDKHDHKHEHKTEHKNEHKTEHKPELKSKLKTQHSVARDADLVKQSSAASET